MDLTNEQINIIKEIIIKKIQDLEATITKMEKEDSKLAPYEANLEETYDEIWYEICSLNDILKSLDAA